MNKEDEDALRDLEKKGVRIHRYGSDEELSKEIRKASGAKPGGLIFLGANGPEFEELRRNLNQHGYAVTNFRYDSEHETSPQTSIARFLRRVFAGRFFRRTR